MTDLPRAVNTEQLFLADHSQQLGRVADLLAEQNELLRQVLTARQAGQPDATDQPSEAGPVAVKLREPEPPAEPDPEPPAVELRKPEPTPADKTTTRPARGGRRAKAST